MLTKPFQETITNKTFYDWCHILINNKSIAEKNDNGFIPKNISDVDDFKPHWIKFSNSFVKNITCKSFVLLS